MVLQHSFTVRCSFLIALLVVLAGNGLAQKKSKYVCSEPSPQSLCTAENTCGSASSPCTIDIRKVGGSSSATPSIPNAKGNQFFCIKAGTSVTWMTSNKNTGFMVSFGTDSPFMPDDPIMGGGNKQVSVKAHTPGCYKYDVGAFYSGATYGMGGGSKPELVILP
jgi:hypothetical protein